MKFQQVTVFLTSLFVIPALSETLEEALGKLPDTRVFRESVLSNPNAVAALAGSGKREVTLFIPSNKAMTEHQKATGQIFRRAASQPGADRTTYHSANDRTTIPDMQSQELVLNSRNTDLATGKPNDVVTAPGNGTGPSQPSLRMRATNDCPNVTLYSGLGTTSRIIAGDYQFDKGIIHIIDT
jgi:hypothetical protein